MPFKISQTQGDVFKLHEIKQIKALNPSTGEAGTSSGTAVLLRKLLKVVCY